MIRLLGFLRDLVSVGHGCESGRDSEEMGRRDLRCSPQNATVRMPDGRMFCRWCAGVSLVPCANITAHPRGSVAAVTVRDGDALCEECAGA